MLERLLLPYPFGNSASFHHATSFHSGSLTGSQFRRHPVEQFFLLSAVVEAEGGKSHTELVMAARFKSAEPAFREFFHLFDHVLRTRFRLLLAVCIP